jgi:predicted HD phosphohydrolase
MLENLVVPFVIDMCEQDRNGKMYIRECTDPVYFEMLHAASEVINILFGQMLASA